MAKSIKARTDVAVSTYMVIGSENDQPATTVGLKQSNLPSGYFSGGSSLQDIASDNDITYNSVAGVELSQGASAVQIVQGGDACVSKTSGVLILRNSGKTTSAKTANAAAAADIEIYLGTAGSTTKLSVLTVENKDVLVIPNVQQAMSVFKAKALGSGSTVWLEYTCICD